MKVAKFGGSSLADPKQIRKVMAIIKSDPERQVIVVSAPGKRFDDDEKITDLLYEWQKLAKQKEPYEEVKGKILDRFSEIVFELGIDLDIIEEIQNIEHVLNNSEEGTPAYAASRGEYLSGRILAEALGFTFVHSAGCIYFDTFGKHISDDERIRKVFEGNQGSVIPGFYGAVKFQSTQIRTFSRGGSDLTGALVARALKADVYENWTDVSGLLACDPRIISKPSPVKKITYPELRELAYMGAKVFHEEAMFPVDEAGIPTNIRNTNEPDHPGTMIHPSLPKSRDRIITGIAGRKGFVVIVLSKRLMNKEVGFARKVLSVLESQEVGFEHMPGGIDTLSIVIDKEKLGDKLETIVSYIDEAVSPDSIKVLDEMAMIAVVGRSMLKKPGVAVEIFSAVAKKDISFRLISQGASELSIIIGVDSRDRKVAIDAIYQKVFE